MIGVSLACRDLMTAFMEIGNECYVQQTIALSHHQILKRVFIFPDLTSGYVTFCFPFCRSTTSISNLINMFELKENFRCFGVSLRRFLVTSCLPSPSFPLPSTPPHNSHSASPVSSSPPPHHPRLPRPHISHPVPQLHSPRHFQTRPNRVCFRFRHRSRQAIWYATSSGARRSSMRIWARACGSGTPGILRAGFGGEGGDGGGAGLHVGREAGEVDGLGWEGLTEGWSFCTKVRVEGGVAGEVTTALLVGLSVAGKMCCLLVFVVCSSASRGF